MRGSPSLPVALLAPWVLAACGDSLVGGPAMDELLGLEPGTDEVGWELRWFRGPGEGLLVGCELAEPWSGPQAVEDVVMGVTVMPPPELVALAEPPVLMVGDSYTWALAMMVLGERLPWAAAGPDRNELTEDRGIWGIVPSYAVLVVDGDLERFAEEMPLGMESFQGALLPMYGDEQASLVEGGIPVTRLETVDSLVLEVFSGEALGGVERQDCSGEDPEEGAR